MDKDDVKRIEVLEQRVSALEKACTQTDKPDRDIVELDLTLPEAGIGGLHFNEQKVHAVFEKKADGKYYSRDILFNSARDMDERTGRDILTEYLNTEDLKQSFYLAISRKYPADFLYRMGLKCYTDIEVSLPEENQGIRKYNGVRWWYWLRPQYSGSAAYFCLVDSTGIAGHHNASAVGGCAPAFRVA